MSHPPPNPHSDDTPNLPQPGISLTIDASALSLPSTSSGESRSLSGRLDELPNEEQSSPNGLVDVRISNEGDRDASNIISNPGTPLSPNIRHESESVPSSLCSSRSSPQHPDLRDVSFGHIDLLSPWFPKVDPVYDTVKGFRRWRIWHSKRRRLLLNALLTSYAVLVTNIVILVVLAVKHGIRSNRGLIKLFEGDCSEAKKIGIGAHVCINILSTLLLGASNLCMQLLVAPTRHEVDAAHRKKIWLDIGIQSWRNLTNIEPSRRWLWALLASSSIPLHFIYNSAISNSIPQYGYATVVASESFIHGTDNSIGNWTDIINRGVDLYGFNEWPSPDLWNNSQGFEEIRADANNTLIFERLENQPCVEKYSNVFSARSSLVVVTEDLPGDKNASVHQYVYWPAIYGGMSRYNPCNLGDSLASNPSCQDLSDNTAEQYKHWRRFNRTVLYCLSKRIDDHCSINYSPEIFIAVCCFSIVKCACILGTILTHKESTISTIGDAVASFLELPDEASAHMGPVTTSHFTKRKSATWGESSTIRWRPNINRWYSAPSRRRWLITISLCAIAIVVALATAIPGAKGSKKRLHSMTFAWQMKQPIGTANPNAFAGYFLPRDGVKGFIANVIYANMWQVIISFLYLAYNALLTCMLVSVEWSRFASERKTLRVTHPRGIQRSSYFISMPYKYGIPLMAANTVLHILISQSMFIISTVSYLPNFVEVPENSYTVTGYSTSAIIISICVGFSTVLILVGISFVKISSGIPLVATCSIAISAACHRPDQDTDAHLLPVRWGVITTDDESPVRCSFTTLRNVRSPKVGEAICGKRLECGVDWVETPTPWMEKAWRYVAAWFVKIMPKNKVKALRSVSRYWSRWFVKLALKRERKEE